MDKASVIRFVGLVIVMINAVLNMFGFETIPVEFGEHISALILIGYGLYAAWKNNYLSQKGQAQKEVLEQNGLK
jgi:SPP1 family holin